MCSSDLAAVRTSPTLPAIERYTGVLYDALDVRTLTRAQRGRAGRRLAVGSALFGVVRADDPIPAYRLSAGSSLPGLPSLRALWRPVLAPALAADGGLVVDLRSGAYADLAPVPGAVTVQVLSRQPDGSRVVVSHFNKAHKGRLARLLATTTGEPDGVVRLRARASRPLCALLKWLTTTRLPSGCRLSTWTVTAPGTGARSA